MVLTHRSRVHMERIAEYVASNFRDYDDPGCETAIHALTGFYAFTHSLDDDEALAFDYVAYLACGRAMGEKVGGC